MKSMKRAVKDSVFTKMFNEPKYSLDLYKALHPEDKTVTESDIKTTTLDPIITDGIYNDLSFLVRDKLIILVEAQSTWSVNILWRHFFYLAETYKSFIAGREKSLHGIRKVYFPVPEMYVIYTGTKSDISDIISLKEEFLTPNSSLELTAKVITNPEKYDIISQYIRFAHKVDYYKTQPGDKQTKALKILDECIAEGILVEFLTEHRAEVLEIMNFLFDPDYIYKAYEKELAEIAEEKGMARGMAKGMAKGMAQGLAQGKAQGMHKVLDALIAKGAITKELADQVLAEETATEKK